MGKNQSASNLTNIIQQDANGNITFVSGSTTLMTLNTAGVVSGSSPAAYAVTASYADSFIVKGNLTAQTLVVQTITSSVSTITGSTQFGSSSINTHQFTGSVLISGSLTGTSATFNSSSSRMMLINSTNANGPYIALQVNGSDEFYIGKSNSVGAGSGYYDMYANAAGGGLRFYTSGSASPSLTIALTGITTFNSSEANGWYSGFSNSSSNFAYIGATAQFANSGGTSTDFGIRSANALVFYTGGGNERIRITSGGNLQVTGSATFSSSVTAVGLSSTTSASGNLNSLIRNNVTSASGTTGYGLAIESEASAATSYALTVRNLAGSTTYFHILTETGKVGNVGIGTTAPITKLEVNGYGAANSIMTYPCAKFYGGGTGGINIGTDGTAAMIATDTSGADMQFLTRVAGVFSSRMTIASGGNVSVSNLLSADRLSFYSTSLYGKKVVKADNVSSFAFNLSTMFPEMSSTFTGNVIGCFGVYTIFRGGAAETGTFSISRNSGGTWSSAAYSVQTATGAYSLSNVTGSGTTITMTFNTAIYVIVEVTAMI
jgi:hypothetical protein